MMLACALKGIEGPHWGEQRHKCLSADRDKRYRFPLSMRPLHCFVLSIHAHLKQRLCIMSSLHVWSAHSDNAVNCSVGIEAVFAASKTFASN